MIFVCIEDDGGKLFEETEGLPGCDGAVSDEPGAEGNLRGRIGDDERMSFAGAIIDDSQGIGVVQGLIFDENVFKPSTNFVGCVEFSVIRHPDCHTSAERLFIGLVDGKEGQSFGYADDIVIMLEGKRSAFERMRHGNNDSVKRETKRGADDVLST